MNHEPETKNFVVVPKTMGRCGSTWFCDMLDSHPAICCVGEVFNPGLTDQYADVLQAWESTRSAQSVFDAIRARYPGTTRAGFKTFREQIGDDAIRFLIESIDCLVFIERRNLTAALVSELHAGASKLWHAQNSSQADQGRDAPPIEVDVRAGRNRLQNALRTGEIVAGMASTAGCRVIEVAYEDLVDDIRHQMNRVFDGLGVPRHAVSSKFVKIHKDSSFVANLDEVNRELGPDFGYLE